MKKRTLRSILLGLVAILLIIQLFPGEKPPVIEENPEDIHQEVVISSDVSYILKAACYDCHSNETLYPWYGDIAPISWLVRGDVDEGRSELNFSEWGDYDLDRKHHKLEEMIEEVEEGEMPLDIYTVMHAEAELTETQAAELISWAKAEMERLKPGS